MKLNERQQKILKLTEEKGRITTSSISRTLDVSEMTVRRDLQTMEAGGFIKRYHGGALIPDTYIHYPIDMRIHVNEKEKRMLAKRAEKHLNDGQTIFIGSSSTCAYIIPYIKNYRDMTVITNSVGYLHTLSKYGVRCLLTGGEYNERERSLLGRDAESFLLSINPDAAFLSCDGISDNGMITLNDPNEAAIIGIMFRNAAKKIFLADSSKLGKKYRYNICAKTDADDIIII